MHVGIIVKLQAEELNQLIFFSNLWSLKASNHTWLYSLKPSHSFDYRKERWWYLYYNFLESWREGCANHNWTQVRRDIAVPLPHYLVAAPSVHQKLFFLFFLFSFYVNFLVPRFSTEGLCQIFTKICSQKNVLRIQTYS